MDAELVVTTPRLDPWRASLAAITALSVRLDEVDAPDRDVRARQLMAQVTLLKATSFLALLLPDGRILEMTPAALTAAGVDRMEVVGQRLWETAWCRHSDDASEELRRAVERAADGRFARFDVDLLLGGGGTATETIDLVVRPLRSEDGQIAFVLAEGRQVSDRRRAQERMARQNAELSVLTERLARVHHYRERLLADVSHDLRSPLQAVLTRAERLRRRGGGQVVESEVQGIRLAALDALEQVDAMLEEVRRNQGETRLALVDEDLASVLRGVAGQFEPLAADRRIELLVDTPLLLRARFDPERMSRVISNLLANALRFTPADGVIRCSLAAVGEWVRLEVADSGRGVPREQRVELFERFHAVDQASGRAGSGLGLAIVKEFVALHGGVVDVDDAPEGGALFAVRLPLQHAEADAKPLTLAQQLASARRSAYVREHLAAELSGIAPGPLPELELPTVVLVEADGDRARDVAVALDRGAAVYTVAAGDEAVRLALDLRPDLMLVGTPLGGVTPADLLERVAREERLHGMLRAAIVLRGDSATRDALLDAGAQDFIAEPAAPDELRSRLAPLLEHAALRRRAEVAEAELHRIRAQLAHPAPPAAPPPAPPAEAARA
jgi:signal transduction histidine kinase/DNA-binding NarL/FixJ family response regulator